MDQVVAGMAVDIEHTVSKSLLVHGSGDLLNPVLDNALNHVTQSAAQKIHHIAAKLRLVTHVISKSGEAEAIGRALRKKSKADVSVGDIHELIAQPTNEAGHLLPRIKLALARIWRDVVDAYQLGCVLNETRPEILDRVNQALPKGRWIRKPKRELKAPKLKESDEGGTFQDDIGDYTLQTGFIDDDAWDMAVAYYRDANLPPRSGSALYDEEKGYFRYDWEMEQDLTQDFVERVRDGQVEAANQNGITEFVWISVVDDKTDDCCLWRDGLLTSEIRAELKAKHSEDECQAEVPPAHYMCRCTLAGATDEMPAQERFSYEDFDQWINS